MDGGDEDELRCEMSEVPSDAEEVFVFKDLHTELEERGVRPRFAVA